MSEILKKCFIICPIGEENSNIRKNSDKLFEFLLTPICKELEFECTRSDKENNTNSITSDILNHLKNDDLVIADLSEYNPNVFYEVGFRKALGLPIIHIKNKSTTLPFDVYDVRTIDFSFDISDIESAKKRIISTIQSLNFKPMQNNQNTTNINIANLNMQHLELLYDIQDDVKYIKEHIKQNNTEAVSVLADKLVNSNKLGADEVLLQTVISEFFKNPKFFLELSEQLPKN